MKIRTTHIIDLLVLGALSVILGAVAKINGLETANKTLAIGLIMEAVGFAGFIYNLILTRNKTAY